MNKKSKEGNTEKPKQIKGFSRIKGPITLLRLLYKGLIKRNAFSKPSFWIGNVFFLFLCVKATQFFLFVKHFEVQVPRDEMINNLVFITAKNLKVTKPEKINEYLDNLEKEKFKRNNLMHENNKIKNNKA